MMKLKNVLATGLLLALISVPGLSASSQGETIYQSKTNQWLTDTEDMEIRWLKLEKYLRGFDQVMLETGQRYQALHQAIQDDNYDLAIYQWKKIRTTIENGLMKRPARVKNAKLLLLDSVWQEVMDSLKSKDKTRARLGFNRAKAACMSCHVAEKKSFINNQPMFKLALK